MTEVPLATLEAHLTQALRSGDTGPALEAIQEGFKRFQEEGVDSIAATMHPEYELHMEALFLDGSVYKGVEGLKQWRVELADVFEWDIFEPQALRFASDEHFGVFGRLRCKSRTGGAELDVPFIHVYEMRDGKIRRLTMYSDAAKALAALGLDASPTS